MWEEGGGVGRRVVVWEEGGGDVWRMATSMGGG